ncbi:MAG TPA: hypothetical protein VMH87_07405 [Pseudomonadales bacterium]|nr:hypothetical protein [Pseudomonadales bacterium]
MKELLFAQWNELQKRAKTWPPLDIKLRTVEEVELLEQFQRHGYSQTPDGLDVKMQIDERKNLLREIRENERRA